MKTRVVYSHMNEHADFWKCVFACYYVVARNWSVCVPASENVMNQLEFLSTDGGVSNGC